MMFRVYHRSSSICITVHPEISCCYAVELLREQNVTKVYLMVLLCLSPRRWLLETATYLTPSCIVYGRAFLSSCYSECSCVFHDCIISQCLIDLITMESNSYSLSRTHTSCLLAGPGQTLLISCMLHCYICTIHILFCYKMYSLILLISVVAKT